MALEEKKTRYSSIDIDGVKYKTLITDKFKRRKKYQEPDPTLALAFIPGTVAKILIKEKNKVKAGDLILTLEAMKMLNKVFAPVDGEVVFHVKEKDIVRKNQLLFKIV